MKLPNMDLNLFVVFDTVYAEQNLTRAAKRLHITQPAVSNALKRLERSLGTRLIDRGPRTFRLTASGRALFRECTGILLRRGRA